MKILVDKFYLRRVFFSSQNVNQVKRPIDTIRSLVPHTDENDWDAGSHANCVLCIETLYGEYER